MKLYNIIETRRINGIESVKTINNQWTPSPILKMLDLTMVIG